jgi:putative transposase/transposase-like zinc-binding protein
VVELAQVLARHWPEYQRRFGEQILPSHQRAVQAILSCRTAQLGGETYRCEGGHLHFAYHSCNHRACPKCGHQDANDWIERQKTKLLPVPYFLVTFTLPEKLRALFRSHQKQLYHLFFLESASTLQDIAATPKYLGAELGFLGVLQTWSRQLWFHLHIHYIVPGAGLRADGLRWIRVKDPDYFLPEKLLARRFRTRLRLALHQSPELFGQIPVEVWQQDWVVDIVAVGSGLPALKYLANYVYKTAFASQRILCDDGQQITFSYKDSKDGQWKPATLTPEEFIRRFLQHVLPAGFQRVRYFGWLSAAAKTKRQRIFALLDWKAPELAAPTPRPVPLCPLCQKPLHLIGRFTRGPP